MKAKNVKFYSLDKDRYWVKIHVEMRNGEIITLKGEVKEV
jgi:hypothetical protein